MLSSAARDYRKGHQRGMLERILDVLHFIKSNQDKGGNGVNQLTIQYGCELNFSYVKSLKHELLEKGLIYSTDSRPRRYLLTKLGLETYKSLLKEMKAIGYSPKINESRDPLKSFLM